LSLLVESNIIRLFHWKRCRQETKRPH